MIDEQRVELLLERGGLVLGDPGQESQRYDGTRDPEGVEELGAALADEVRALAPGVIVVGQDVADAVLAHVVARELGAHIVLTFDAEGLVAHSGDLAADDRAVVLADTDIDASGLGAMISYVQTRGAHVVGVAVLVGTSSPTDASVPTMALTRARDAGATGTGGGSEDA